MKKKFRVWATYRTECYLEVEAEDLDEAYDIAKDTDGDNFTDNDDYHVDQWDIDPSDIEEL